VLNAIPDTQPFTAEVLLSNMDELMTQQYRDQYRAQRELDTLVVLPTGERFRVNCFWEKGNPACAARYIPSSIPSLDDLLAPEAAYDFVRLKQGLCW